MKRAPKTLWVLLALIASVGILKATLPQVVIGNWTASNPLSQARSGASAVMLPDGRILFIGGDSGAGPQQSVEVFATDGSVSAAAAMNVPRSREFAVVLTDGRVLVGGGLTSGGGTTNSAEIYDPSNDSWTATNPMTLARANATAAVLPDGRVVIAGGDNSGAPSNTLEIYDPSSGSFNFAGAMSASRTQHAMAVLQDGRVLIAGGFDGTNPLASSDIFDPSSGTVSAGPNLAVARYSHSATALLNGEVAVIGGAGNGNNGPVDLASIEIFDPSTGSFTTSSANLATARQGHQAFLLPNNNNVLIVGGTTGGTALASSELLTPQVSTSTGAWSYSVSATGAMTTARTGASVSANQLNGPTAVASPKPGLVVVGGGTDATGATLASTEVYGYPTVQTDQVDYPPGTTVNITGSGFQPNETVAITLVESPLIDTHGPYTVVADGNGNISDSSFTTDIHDLNVRFWLSAVGSTSGLVAQNTFTDGNIVVFSAPSGVTFTLNFQSFNSSTSCSGTPNSTGSPGIQPNQRPNNGNVGVGNPESVELQAPPLSDQGGPFQNWSWTGTTNETIAVVGGSPVLASPTTNATICIEGSAANKVNSGTFTATYATAATAPNLTNLSVTSGDLATTIPTLVLTGTNFVANSTVSFSGTGITVGTTTINNSTQITVTNVAISMGATLGGHNVTVTNPGSGGGSATSSIQTFTVNKRTSTTSVACTPSPDNIGSATSCTATITDNDSGTAVTLSGSVSFTSTGTGSFSSSGSCNLSGGGATATCSVSYTPSAFGTGTHTITASYGGDGAHLTSNGNFNLSVNNPATTTTISSSANPSTYGDSVTFTATVSPNSGTSTPTGTVQFVIDGGSPIAGTAGTCPVSAPANSLCATYTTSSLTVNGGTAHSVQANYTHTGNFSDSSGTLAGGQLVNKANATVVVTPYTSATVTYDGHGHTATYTITGVNGEAGATVGTVDVSNTTHTNAGTYATDSWSFTGTANYNNIAATTITDSVGKANATVVVTPYTSATVTYDGHAHTATYTITGVNGETGATVGTVTLNTTHTNAGTYSSDSWSFTGAANYNDIASTTITDSIAKANATVVVTPYTNVPYDGQSHMATVASITGVNGETGATVGTATLNTTHTNAGTYSSDSWSFTGAANYNDIASTTITDSIAKANATVVVTPYSVTYDGNAHSATVAPITGVNGETGATVGTVDVSNTSHTNAGTYTTDSWSFTGTANYNNIAATTITDTINKANVTVMFSNVGPFTYNGNPQAPTYAINGVGIEVLTAYASVSYSGTQFDSTPYSNASPPFHGGAYSQVVSFAGNGNYNPLNPSATQGFTINKASQTITFGALANHTFGDLDFPLNATSSSGLVVSFTATGSCTVSGVTVHITGAGSCTVTASQLGSNDYNAASPVQQTFTIAKATPDVNWSNPANITYGTTLSSTQLSATFTWVVNGSTITVPGTATYTPGAGTVLNPGQAQTLTVNFTPTDTVDYNPTSGTVKINVVFATGGMCNNGLASHIILQPINADGTSVFKAGSTVPTKFVVCDAFGNSVGPNAAFPNSSVVKSYIVAAATSGTVSSVDETQYSTTPDTYFRWDPTAQQWIFNQATGKSTNLTSTGVTYLFQITLIDGTVISGTNSFGVPGYQFGLK